VRAERRWRGGLIAVMDLSLAPNSAARKRRTRRRFGRFKR